MRHFFAYLSFVMVTAVLSSCIHNDLPYPQIKGEVIKFSAYGQKETKIDPVKRTISVTLSDSVDIRSMRITEFQITEGATSTLDPKQPINYKHPIKFMLQTYQDYEWTLDVVQPIDRVVSVENQIGEAVVDVPNLIVTVKVAEDQDMKAIKIEKMQLGPSISTISPDPLTVSDFSNANKKQMFTVKYFDIEEHWTVYVLPTRERATTSAADAWGTFAYLKGMILEGSADAPAFEIKKKGDANWKVITGEALTVEGKKISAKATGLTPETAYVYRAKLGEDAGNEVEFTTEATPPIPNLSFEDWHQSANGKTWYPNLADGNSFWATGNEGVTIVGLPCTTQPTDDAVKGKAAYMISKPITASISPVKFAAGSLYTGVYSTNMGDPIKSAVFGRPYTGRPVAIKGWYKYKSMPIVANKHTPTELVGTPDRCHIYIRLENWGSATTPPENPILVGYAELQSDENVPQYKQFNIEVEYKELTLKPTHVILTATSSYKGGIFIGGTDSELYVDEFELVF